MPEPKYFISYSRKDSDFVVKLAEELRAAGASLWLDQLDIPIGHRWDRAIQQAVDECEAMIIVLSPNSVDSDNVLDEIDLALEEGKRIVPILIASCTIPLRLRRMQRIDFISDYTKGFDQLLGVARANRPVLPTMTSSDQRPNTISSVVESIQRNPQGLELKKNESSSQLISPADFDEKSSFRGGLAQVRKGKKWGFVDKHDRVVIPIEYERVGPFSEGLARVKKKGSWGFVDQTGKVVVALEFGQVRPFNQGLARVRKNTQWGLVDKAGKVILPIEFDLIYEFSEARAAVKKGDKWGFVDQTGQLIIPFVYDHVNDFREGLAQVRKGEKYGFINQLGITIIPYEYSYAYSFRDGLAMVLKGKWGFVNQTGKPIIPFVYDRVTDFREGLAEVWQGNRHYYINKTGEEVKR